TFDPRIPAPNLTTILETLLAMNETRDAAWTWFQSNVDQIAAKRQPSRRGSLPWMGAHFCDRAHGAELSTLFAERIQSLEGGPRNLAGALEAINLCAARRTVQEPSFRKAFKLPVPKDDAKGAVPQNKPKSDAKGAVPQNKPKKT